MAAIIVVVGTQFQLYLLEAATQCFIWKLCPPPLASGNPKTAITMNNEPCHRFVLLSACNVVYMNNVDTESLTGPKAISRAVHHTFSKEVLETTIATFKVSSDGITVTDNNRK